MTEVASERTDNACSVLRHMLGSFSYFVIHMTHRKTVKLYLLSFTVSKIYWLLLSAPFDHPRNSYILVSIFDVLLCILTDKS